MQLIVKHLSEIPIDLLCFAGMLLFLQKKSTVLPGYIPTDQCFYRFYFSVQYLCHVPFRYLPTNHTARNTQSTIIAHHTPTAPQP